MAKKKIKPKSGKSAPVLNREAVSGGYSSGETSVNSAAALKVCRLCETKDGPFLNVFESDQVIAKKIDELLPFKILEDDILPHKICFRCSAKVEELYEFVQKCSKTQDNLNRALGREAIGFKYKTRMLWDEKLNQSNMSNDDICDNIIKKAMQALTDGPLSIDSMKIEDEPKVDRRISLKREAKNAIKMDSNEEELPIKQIRLEKTSTKHVESKTLDEKVNKSKKPSNSEVIDKQEPTQLQAPQASQLKHLLSFDYDDTSNSSTKEKSNNATPPKEEKPFNIMDHISTIKVNGVGTLFQCKLCNRNFLKKEMVLAHGCAKSGKTDVRKSTPPPEPPKVAPNTVKYINTKTESKKSTEKPVVAKAEEVPKADVKIKPKIGPASKVKKVENDSSPSVGMTIHPRAPTPPTKSTNAPVVQFPTIPSLNSRYKLVPGPNNTFTLIEDPNSIENQESKPKQKPEDIKAFLKTRPGLVVRNEVIDLDEDEPRKPGPRSSKLKKQKTETMSMTKEQNDESKMQSSNPYPVSMFQSPQHIAQPVANNEPPALRSQPTFTTPAMRKQSYTVVQTGNPSKLLISSRPQQPATVEEKRKNKPSKSDVSPPTNPSQPFKVTLEDATPKSSGFFTYVNIDPLLQPSHVVPVDNIIQESQISTSTSVVKLNKGESGYSCNLCGEKFSREKKLQSHIQAHFSKMDEEDQMRDKHIKKRK